VKRHRVALALLLAAGLLLGAGASARAQEKGGRIPMNVLVTHLSNQGKGVDADARKLDGKLRGQFRYDSLQVLEKRRIDLELDEVGRIDLPNGRSARVQPIHKSDQGVLMAVDVENAARIDARVKNHNLLVIRAGRYDDGDLVLSLEPDYTE
jgi:hypothetical protein